MHEGPHRPILSNDLACQADHAPEFHAPGFDVDGVVYRFHVTDSMTAPARVG